MTVASPQRGRRLAATMVVAGLLLSLLPSGASASATTAGTAASATGATGAGSVGAGRLDPGLVNSGAVPQRVVVSATRTGVDQLRRSVLAFGGRVRAELPIIDGLAVTVPAHRLAALAALPGVVAVTADRAVHYTSQRSAPAHRPLGATASTFAHTTEASTGWSRGATGRGIGVAVLDTGVSPMRDLRGRLVHGPDLSGEGSVIDSYGHGTVMAGIIAGSGADSAGHGGGSYTGVAPGARVIAVKAAGRNGATDVTTILQGLHWVSAYQRQYNIRVLNLSWGVPSTQSPTVDPLNFAVQRLWRQGIVVVVAAGNRGNAAGTVNKPADDPLVLTVGAYDEQGDTDQGNDKVAEWSSRGPTKAGLAKPDLVAPGRTLIAARAYGSAVEADNPDALVAPSYIKGSGTSEAAAVTSGVVALLLSARPGLTPDQVKKLLVDAAAPIAGASRGEQGAGRVQLAAALTAPAGAPRWQRATSTGLGSIEASRAGRHVTASCSTGRVEIAGERDVRCEAWQPKAWAASKWTGNAWTGNAWTGNAWTAAQWTGNAWTGGIWSGNAWTGNAWTGSTWTGNAWTGNAWTGSTWTGNAWTGNAWTGNAWTAEAWASAFWGSQPPPGSRLPGEVAAPTTTAEG